MAAEADLRQLLPRPIRELPADLAAVIGLVLITDVVVLAPVLRETPLRVILGLPLVLFLPGYAFIAALFPEAGQSPEVGETKKETAAGRRGIDDIERVALSFGLSIAIVPLIGLVLNFTPWGIRLIPILVSVSGFTLIAAVIGARRRRALPPEERFRVPYREALTDARDELLRPESRTDAALNVLLAASVVLAAASVGYAVAVPKQGESFTEFYLLTRTDGELVANGYPTEFSRGEGRPIIIGIGNQEHEAKRYTVVIELQRVSIADNETSVQEAQELDRLRASLEHNETYHVNHTVRPTFVGERLRLAFLLYVGEPPENPTIDNAYRELHLWINVTR